MSAPRERVEGNVDLVVQRQMADSRWQLMSQIEPRGINPAGGNCSRKYSRAEPPNVSRYISKRASGNPRRMRDHRSSTCEFNLASV